MSTVSGKFGIQLDAVPAIFLVWFFVVVIGYFAQVKPPNVIQTAFDQIWWILVQGWFL
jgi:hypothetical protein